MADNQFIVDELRSIKAEIKTVQHETTEQSLMLIRMDGKLETIKENVNGKINMISEKVETHSSQLGWLWKICFTIVVGSGAIYTAMKFITR